MLILLDCRPLLSDPFNEETGRFIISCAAGLSKEHGVEWLFLLNKSYRGSLFAKIPSAQKLTCKTFPFRIGRQIWDARQLSVIEKTVKPDLVMISYGGPRHKILLPVLTGARALFCFSEQDRAFLISTRGIPAGKIILAPLAADVRYRPLSEDKKEKVKQDHAQGREYFLTIVSGARKDELVGLLKAFSLFKKRQRSNMQLLLAGAGPGISRREPGSSAGLGIIDGLGLNTYKYRSSIHILNDPAEEELIRLMGAAYAFVSPFSGTKPGVDLLNAWAAETPVITHGGTWLPEMNSDAVLVVEPEEPVSMAEGMMRVYKDEGLRNRLLENGRLGLLAFPRDRATARVWEGILRAMS